MDFCEDGGAEGSQVNLILWLHLHNSHINANKKEHDLKTDRLSTAKRTDKATIKRVERMKMEWKTK